MPTEPTFANTEELLAQDAFVHVLDATLPVPALGEALLEILDSGGACLAPASH